jgi:hypothetical protein
VVDRSSHELQFVETRGPDARRSLAIMQVLENIGAKQLQVSVPVNIEEHRSPVIWQAVQNGGEL